MKHQYSLELIPRQLQNSTIAQRAADGYINATQLCEAASRRWYQYERQEVNGTFLRALAAKEGKNLTELVQHTLSTDTAEGEQVWVHPKVALHLGQWLSPAFALQVTDWVYEWMNGRGAPKAPAQLPYHLQRHMDNLGKVPHTHFSILQEMTTYLIAPLEIQGYTLPDNMLPDISQGRMFCKFARETLGVDTDALPTYNHRFPDGRIVPAKLYPVEHLGHFRKFISEVWLPERAQKYFKERDPKALPRLDKVLRLGAPEPAPAL